MVRLGSIETTTGHTVELDYSGGRFRSVLMEDGAPVSDLDLDGPSAEDFYAVLEGAGAIDAPFPCHFARRSER